MKWIKTSERLPTKSILVLMLLDDSPDGVLPAFGSYYAERSIFYCYSGHSITSMSEVLYWGPYPELPEDL